MENKPLTETGVESSLYDTDFFEWTQSVGEGLLRGRLSKADLEHIAEEITDMGKRDRREMYSRMTVLLMHLMKWAAQPERREGSTWDATIIEQRTQITYQLEDSPSLRSPLIQRMPKICVDAARSAATETGLPMSTFTAKTFSQIDQLLSLDWYPERLDDLFLLTR